MHSFVSLQGQLCIVSKGQLTVLSKALIMCPHYGHLCKLLSAKAGVRRQQSKSFEQLIVLWVSQTERRLKMRERKNGERVREKVGRQAGGRGGGGGRKRAVRQTQLQASSRLLLTPSRPGLTVMVDWA